jgi:ankyrin repeat protein
MIVFKFRTPQLDMFDGLKRFLMARTPAEMSIFIHEAQENLSYSNLFSCPLIKETSLSALSICVILGKKEHIDYLLSLGCVTPEADNNLALRLSAIRGDLAITQTLLQFEEVIKRVSVDHNFPLKAAILNGDLALMNHLLRFQDIQHEIAQDNNHLLRAAAESGNQQIFDSLMIFPEVLAELTALNNDALNRAAMAGNTYIVERLLAFPEVRDKFFESDIPLEYAIKYRHTHIALCLLLLGAEATWVRQKMEHYLALASQEGLDIVVERLFAIYDEVGVGTLPFYRGLMLAIKHDMREVLNVFSRRPEIHAYLCSSNHKAISIAASYGRINILNQLLSYPNALNNYSLRNNEALCSAAQQGSPDLIMRLLDIPSVKDAASSQDNLALRRALYYKKPEAARLLLQIAAVRTDAHVDLNYSLSQAAQHGFEDIVTDLLTLQNVAIQADSCENFALETAAKNGHLRIVHRLITNPWVRASLISSGFAPLQNAVNHDHLDIVHYLLTHPEIRPIFNRNFLLLLRGALYNNAPNVARYLLSFPEAKNCILGHEDELLVSAARLGQIPLMDALLNINGTRAALLSAESHVVHLVCELGHEELLAFLLSDRHLARHIAFFNNRAMWLAVQNSHLGIVRQLLQYRRVCEQIADNNQAILKAAIAKDNVEILSLLMDHPHTRDKIDWLANPFELLEIAAQTGNLKIIRKLLQYPAVSEESLVLVLHGLCPAASKGHNDIVDKLLEIEHVQLNAHLFENSALISACSGGHLRIVQKLFQLPSVRNQTNIKDAFLNAIKYGHDPVVAELLQYDAIQSLVATNGNEPLRIAAMQNRPSVVNTLLLFPEVCEGIHVSEHIIYRIAVRDKRIAIIQILLNIPSVLNYAESYEPGRRYIFDHVCQMVQSIRKRKEYFEETHQIGMFDVTFDEALALFYALKYCIRRRDRGFQTHIDLLLSIPRLVSILHAEITPGIPNELLQLAIRQRSREIIIRLLDFPEVRRIAAANQYYQQADTIDIQRMVMHQESAMIALNPTEQQQLNLLQQRYLPEIDAQGGVARFFIELNAELRRRYEEHPATISLQGSVIRLPFLYEDFQSLNLIPEEQAMALSAYYTHTEHTACRFLSKPNRWIHPEAEYVEVDPENPHLRNASFETYVPMICCFWRAAADGTAIGPREYSPETRQELIIKELALLGRSHNWDRSRPILRPSRLPSGETALVYALSADGGRLQEEFDDGEADKPSCNMGIKQRVFRSLQDHPLFEPLTVESFDTAVRELVVQHFKQAFQTCSNLRMLAHNINEHCFAGVELSPEVLHLNFSEEEISRFVQQLKNEHGERFDAIFEHYVRTCFSLEVSPAHLLNFYTRYNVNHVLELALQNLPPEEPAEASARPDRAIETIDTVPPPSPKAAAEIAHPVRVSPREAAANAAMRRLAESHEIAALNQNTLKSLPLASAPSEREPNLTVTVAVSLEPLLDGAPTHVAEVEGSASSSVFFEEDEQGASAAAEAPRPVQRPRLRRHSCHSISDAQGPRTSPSCSGENRLVETFFRRRHKSSTDSSDHPSITFV